MFYSSDIFNQTEDKTIEQNKIENCIRCHKKTELHLKTSIRSFRAENLCHFVDCLPDNNSKESSRMYELLSEKYPIYVTRDYKFAKKWIKDQVRGS